MDGNTLLALTGFALATVWTPGPNNMMLASSGATFGWRRSVPHAMGVALGFPVMLFLIALGLGEVFQRSESFRFVLSWGGFAVMLWLSWRIATSGPAKSGRRSRPLNFIEASGFPVMLFLIALGLGEVFQRSESFRFVLSWGGFAVMLWLSWRIATSGPAKSGRRSRPLNFIEASGFQWINPKAWVMAIGAAATYVRGADPVLEAGIAAAVFVAAGLSSSQGWLLFGAGIGRVLGTGLRLRAFNAAMGLLLALSALWLVTGA